MSKTLDNLKRDLESALSSMAAASLEVEHIRLAIDAIESGPRTREPTTSTRHAFKLRKRGSVSRAVLDCLRDGIGQVRLIKKTLDERGHDLSANSISNAISRLQEKKIVRHDLIANRWVIIELSGSSKAEGPEDYSLGPLHLNGATDSYSEAPREDRAQV